jgi:AmiR/NasT family two-component response regulator
MKSKLAYIKITRIEQELRSLKKNLAARKKVVAIRGMLKGIKITEDEIDEAKKSLFYV